MAIYITGDIHGDINRFGKLQRKRKTTENDYIIVCGDFGVVWGHPEAIARRLRKIEATFKGKVLFIDGNHENFDILNHYPIVNKFGGKVHKINNQIYHLMRGELYNIEGHTFFCFGGAYSIDRHMRTLGRTFWIEEVPSEKEMFKGGECLYNNLNNIEYVITHEAPNIVRKMFYSRSIEPFSYKLPYIFDNWLKDLTFESKSFKKWFCGHHHMNEDVTKYGFKCEILYENIIKLGGL